MNREFIKDVGMFCTWLAPYLRQTQMPEIYKLVNEDYDHVLDNLKCEMSKLASIRHYKYTRKTYDIWAENN